MRGKRALLNMDEAAKTSVNCITSMKNEHYGKLIDFTSGSKCDTILSTSSILRLFLSLLEKSALQLKQPDLKQSSVVNILSIISSLELAKSLLYYYDYDYQCSKAALNMLTICMGKDLDRKKICFSLRHPGWVKTETGTDKAPPTIDAVAKNILECLQAMTNERHCKLIDTCDGKN
ncbi:unnamed protein product [Rotaria socialis]|uniref:Uncharacterized protein n=1 Tax=Rotaria socialis TaxID=392032 RepID=A0A817ULR1_9BILA|nr:unnamed protein product [Rotaria socialis]